MDAEEESQEVVLTYKKEPKLSSKTSLTRDSETPLSTEEHSKLTTIFSKDAEGKITEGSPIVQRGDGALYKEFPYG